MFGSVVSAVEGQARIRYHQGGHFERLGVSRIVGIVEFVELGGAFVDSLWQRQGYNGLAISTA